MRFVKYIKNYFRKRKERKEHIKKRKIFFETKQRECDCFEGSIMNDIGYCHYNEKINQFPRCNPNNCRYMTAIMEEFDREWEKKNQTNQV